MTDERGPREDARVARADLSRHELDLVPESAQLARPSRKRGVLIALAALVVFGGSTVAFGAYQARATRAASEAAYADLTQCLLGGRPTDADDATLTLRRHQVAWMTYGEDARRGQEREPWPDRCAEPALRLGDASRDFEQATDRLAKGLEQHRGLEPSIWPNLREVVELASGHALAARTPTVSGPPAHPRALTLDDLPDAAFITQDFVAMRGVERSRDPVGAGLVFVDHRGDFGPFWCQLRSPLVCGRVASGLARTKSLALIGSSEGAPLLVDERGTVLRSDSGSAVDRLTPTSAHSRADGLAIVVGRESNDRVAYAVQRKPDGPTVRLDIAAELTPLLGDAVFDGRADDVRVANGLLFVRARVEDSQSLFVFSIGPDGRPLAQIGSALPNVSQLSSIVTCRVGERVTVLARATEGWFLRDGGSTWSQVTSRFVEGLACSDAGTTGVGFAAVQICEPDCRVVSAPNASPDVRPGTNGVAPLGDGIASIEAVGDTGGVRIRRGAPKQPIDSVLFDDRIAAGALTDLPTMAELRVFAVDEGTRRSGLVVLLQTSKGLASLRVQNDGTARPEPVEWSSRQER